MGLTIHYKLKTKGTAAASRKLVEALHQQAHDLPFKEVGDLVDLAGDGCLSRHRDQSASVISPANRNTAPVGSRRPG